MPADTKITTTLLCDQGYHGGPVRRNLAVSGWSGMWEGRCSGTVFTMSDGVERSCACACHLPGTAP